jgi:hypothetical protein
MRRRRADLQDRETVRRGVRRVPDHQNGAGTEDAKDGLKETRFVPEPWWCRDPIGGNPRGFHFRDRFSMFALRAC